jgi:hypothetical protein
MLSELLPILAPVFIAAGLGYGWARLGLAFDTEFVTRLVMSIGAPCLIFSALTRQPLQLADFGWQAAVAVGSVAICGAIGALALTAARVNQPAAYLPSIMFPNTANMGMPVSYFAFGDVGLALAVAYSTTVTLGHFSVGIALASGKIAPGRLFANPAIYAALTALALIAADLEPPEWIANTTRLLGDLTIPLMLIALGVSLARLKVVGLRTSLAVALLRLGPGLGAGVLLAWAFGLEGAAAGVAILQCAMPAAVFNYLFAARYGGPAEEVAGVVVLSTLISAATLPVLLWLVMA